MTHSADSAFEQFVLDRECGRGRDKYDAVDGLEFVYQVSFKGLGNGPVFCNIAEALREIEINFVDLEEGEDLESATITKIKMDAETFNNLPEFTGY